MSLLDQYPLFPDMKAWSLIRYKKWLLPVFLIMPFILVSAWISKVNFNNFPEGLWKACLFLAKMFPPDFSIGKELLEPVLVTLVQALLGTLIGSLLAIPLAFAAASNISPRWLRALTRTLFTIERAIPEIVILLFLVAAMGLGTVPAIITLCLGCLGMMGKLLADSIEEVEANTLEAIKSVGAGYAQTLYYGILPEIMPKIISYALFRLEINIRLSVILGAVGAGGIGYELSYSFGLLEYHRAFMAIILIGIVVFGSERLSFFLRNKIKLEDILV